MRDRRTLFCAGLNLLHSRFLVVLLVRSMPARCRKCGANPSRKSFAPFPSVGHQPANLHEENPPRVSGADTGCGTDIASISDKVFAIGVWRSRPGGSALALLWPHFDHLHHAFVFMFCDVTKRPTI